MRDYDLYLEDIRCAIKKIEAYTSNMDYVDFANDEKTLDSVLHNLVVIGEAAGKIPDELKDSYPGINWAGIIGMRNIIAHAYFNIEPAIIWATITDRLPELKSILTSGD